MNELRQLRNQASQYSELFILAQAERDFYRMKHDELTKGSAAPPSSSATDPTAAAAVAAAPESSESSSEPLPETPAADGVSVPAVETAKDKEKAEVTGIIADYLRTIQELKEKLRAAETQRDEAMLESHYDPRFLASSSSSSPVRT